ncbi:MAG: hypothetical protein AB4050_08845 [Synechococcus sp.]
MMNVKILVNRLGLVSILSGIVFASVWSSPVRSVPANPQLLSSSELWSIEALFPGRSVLGEHTFKVWLPQCGQCTFVPVSDVRGRPELSLHLIKDGQLHYTLPPSEADRTWASFNMLAVAFTDLDNDGQDDIAVLAEYITGIGPTGTQPFPAASIYFSRETVFKHNRQLSQYLTEQGVETIAELISAMESYGY